jgi:hypothetical protein
MVSQENRATNVPYLAVPYVAIFILVPYFYALNTVLLFDLAGSTYKASNLLMYFLTKFILAI